MAQRNWTYYSLTGLPYSIDMYHGEDSGHLILFVNAEIIFIKFKQKESKEYGFLIEHQLIKLKINHKKTGDYNYTLIPQLPANDVEKEKIFTAHFWIPLIIIIIALNLFLSYFFNTF